MDYKNAYEREKKARLAAEELLENKTREIFIINQKLEEKAEALVRSNDELTQFAFIASHDLREPLRKIKTFSEFLVSEYAQMLPEDAQDYITRMNNAADRMDALIEGLLRYSRITRSIEPFIQIDLNKIIKDVLFDLDNRIQETKAIIETEKLPEIEADPMQMHQLLQNLISNALKFHKENQVPKIKIRATKTKDTQQNSYLTLIIADNGIGFDEKYTDKIFGIFQRLHSITEYEGSGIGLSVCKRIIERHKGNIEVKSIPNKGTTFTITLPIKQGAHQS